MNEFRGMTGPTRRDLEKASTAFFGRMLAEVDRPRSFAMDYAEDEVNFNLELSRARIAELDNQLRENLFDGVVEARATALASEASLLTDLSVRDKLYAAQLSARAEREQMVFLIHQLTRPAKRYQPEDEIFEARHSPVEIAIAEDAPPPALGPTLLDVTALYVRMKKNLQQVKTQIEDSSRVLGWLAQRVDGDRLLSTISKQELRTFRDDLTRLAKSNRGRASNFEHRLTDVVADQVASATALRYWGFIRGFFAWAEGDGYIHENPCASLVMGTRKGELRRSPLPFSNDELQHLFATPLYAGHAAKRCAVPGQSFRRDAKWWSGILFMFSGLRAGELAQLEPGDFKLEGDIPYLHVRPEGEAGSKAKSVKSAAAVREIPLAPILLDLGLADFVTGKMKAKRKRVFDEFRLGKGRASDGLSKFWSRYLREVNLWKAGRSTHVWRHTVIARLRDADVAQEDIATIVGHEQGTMTSTYGGAYPLSRKLKTIQKLDYGFDVLLALGGPYNATIHR